MSLDKLVDSAALDANLTSVANAIRTKGGTSGPMAFPTGFVSAVEAIPKKETVEWHQCPETVRSYLAAALAAYPSNNGATIIDQYAPNYINIPEDVSRENSKPIGFTIDGVTFYDNEPLVAEPFATANEAGTLTALDWLRWINTTLAAPATGSDYKRGYNCRDLGGWPCDGGTIKYGMLVRGSEPNPADRDLMVEQVGIKTEVQLLPLSEQGTGYKMVSPWGIDWAGNDTENTKVYSPADVSDPAKKELWTKILAAIIDSVNHAKPVYYHCGVGADRTGVTAMVLEGILGVSSDNVDIDFELTNFALGWQMIDGSVYRGRSYPTYIGLKQNFNAIPLLGGLSDSFRNRCISFALSLGISIDKINAFRAAMIDGTPEVIVLLATYSITKSGENCTFDNSVSEVTEGTSFAVGVTANSGYEITGITVTMGGADVTSSAVSGNQISISSVTGDVVITVATSAKQITNLANPTSAEWKSGYRINGSNSIVSGQSQVTNLIPVAVGDVIRIKGGGSYANMLSATFANAESTTGSALGKNESYDSAAGISTFTITSTAYPYARWSIPNSQIADVNAIIITRNEEIQ